MKKTLKILFVFLGLALMVSNMSNRFDPDFGWHLRFGKEAAAGNFSFLDSYTWGNTGWPWVNHEWGGDLTQWFIYTNFGYLGLLIFVSLTAWIGYLISSLRINKKLSFAGILAALICAWLTVDINILRLATITIFFFSLVLYLASQINLNRRFLWWPIIFWIWSTFHGNWLIGLFAVFAYLSGYCFDLLHSRTFKKPLSYDINVKNLFLAFIFAAISFLVTVLNPYGLRLFSEIIEYFQTNFYQTWIAEWTPSYAYPIFIVPLLAAPLLISFNFYLWKKKRIPTGELFITLIFTIAAIKYRRQWLLASVVAVPALRVLIDYVLLKICELFKEKTTNYTHYAILIITAFLLVFFVSKTDFTRDIWNNSELLSASSMPYQGTKYLKDVLPRNKTTNIFSEFSWGGYLIWALPEAKVYIDGRGSGTWTTASGTPFLKEYYSLMHDSGGLKKINLSSAEYIFIKPQYPIDLQKTKWLNKEFYNFNTPSSSQLHKDLTADSNWEKIYDDKISEIWKRK